MGRKTAPIRVIGVAIGVVFAIGTGSADAQSDPAPTPCAALQAVPVQLRPQDCRLAAAIADGLTRSTTFRQQVERVGALNGIVYIHLKLYVNPQTKRVLDGALSHAVTTAGAYRMLHVMVGAAQGDRAIYILAHELQHAIEVLEAPDVATERAVDQLFERIGTQVFAGAVETQAALDAEAAVRRELTAIRGIRPAS
jgi:hypothetical protein